uniref:Uncharacterized protein n=1 Tax=Timema genevievae TaxID=629358 RepID=A0A7R9PKN2_TIMGE|nr:unnamed protein product [Timema genevievae]
MVDGQALLLTSILVTTSLAQKITLISPNRDSNLDLPVITSLVYCESSALDPAVTEVPLRPDSTGLDMICRPESGHTCPVASAIYGFRDPPVLVGTEGYFGRLTTVYCLNTPHTRKNNLRLCIKSDAHLRIHCRLTNILCDRTSSSHENRIHNGQQTGLAANFSTDHRMLLTAILPMDQLAMAIIFT